MAKLPERLQREIQRRRENRRAKVGRRAWTTRSMATTHYDRLRIVAAHLPKVGKASTMEAAHDLVMEKGLALLEKELL